MREFQFEESLESSLGKKQESHVATIQNMIDGCASVRPATYAENLSGIDYVATLRRGAEVYIDTKERERGCSRFWRMGPELALEIWSKRPIPPAAGKTGWSLDEAKKTHYILFTWDSSDCGDALLVPFQLLRIAFRRHFHEWSSRYMHGFQETWANGGGHWYSECVFVPANVVLRAVDEVQHGGKAAVQSDFGI